MKSLQKVFAFFFMVSLFPSCCTSNMPLDWDKVVTEDFAGEWVSYKDDGYNFYLTIELNEDKDEYNIHRKSANEGKFSESDYTGYLTEVGNYWFMNIRLKEGDYSIFKVFLEADKLFVYEIWTEGFHACKKYKEKDNSVFMFPNPQILKNIIEENLYTPDFFKLYGKFERMPNKQS